MKKILAIIIGAILLILAVCSVSIIPTGYTGIVKVFGAVQDYTLGAGFHVVGFWTSVEKMDNKVQKETTELSCFSSDIQEVNVKYTINYRIDQENAMEIYKSIGKNYYSRVVDPSITESVKIVVAKYTAEQLVEERTELAKQIEEDVAVKLAAYNVIVVATSIEDMDFTDAFTSAVEAKQVAQQEKLKVQIESEQRVIEAQADADVKQIKTDASAYDILTTAEAQAEANKKLSASLTPAVLESMYYDKWNGTLPTVVSDGSAIVKLPE